MVYYYHIIDGSKKNVNKAPIVYQHILQSIACYHNLYHQGITIEIVQTCRIFLSEGVGLNTPSHMAMVFDYTASHWKTFGLPSIIHLRILGFIPYIGAFEDCVYLTDVCYLHLLGGLSFASTHFFVFLYSHNSYSKRESFLGGHLAQAIRLALTGANSLWEQLSLLGSRRLFHSMSGAIFLHSLVS